MDIVSRQVMPSTNISASITKRYISKRRLSGRHYFQTQYSDECL